MCNIIYVHDIDIYVYQSLTIAILQDVKWQAGSQYTPADALAQGLKSLALNETRVLSRTIADWFRSI
jgi:hypothetical protein